MAKINRFIQSCLIAFIRSYQFAISMMLGSCCRFEPSCSSYAIEAMKRHGCLRGGLMMALRLLRCHPWHPGGFDPVPTHNRSRLCQRL